MSNKMIYCIIYNVYHGSNLESISEGFKYLLRRWVDKVAGDPSLKHLRLTYPTLVIILTTLFNEY